MQDPVRLLCFLQQARKASVPICDFFSRLIDKAHSSHPWKLLVKQESGILRVTGAKFGIRLSNRILSAGPDQ